MPDMDGFGFLDEFLNSEDIVTRTSIYMLTSSNDPNEIERALKYPVVKKILRQAIVQRYSQSTIKNRNSLSYEVLYYSLMLFINYFTFFIFN
jgi:CheY-like chemotaxis protein